MEKSKSAKDLSKQRFSGVVIDQPFHELLGDYHMPAIGMIWAENYSGKSTFALGLANALARYGRVEYVPAEEHFSITLTKKINQVKAHHENLMFRMYEGLPELKKWVDAVQPKVVFIDSVSVLSENDSEVVDFATWCRSKDIGMWMVVHANKDGSFKGNSKLAHEADIQIEILRDDKMAYTRKNRIFGELKSIPVPYTHKDITPVKKTGKKPSKQNGKKGKHSDSSNGKVKSPDRFNAEMDKVEALLSGNS